MIANAGERWGKMSQGLTENILLRTTDCLSAVGGGTSGDTSADISSSDVVAHNIINMTVSANGGYQGRVFITPDCFDKSARMNRRQRRAANRLRQVKTKKPSRVVRYQTSGAPIVKCR